MPGAYVYVKPGRAGLGNMLFPWARAVLFSEAHGLSMLGVRWTQLKIGPLLRGERDGRYYVGLFNNDGYITGLRKWGLLTTMPKLGESDATAIAKALHTHRGIIVFQGMQGMFDPLTGHRKLVRQRLEGMLAARVRERLALATTEPYIGLHVRRGDTVTLAYGESYPEGTSARGQPIEWFTKVLQQLRQTLGNIKTVVFSDGTDAQLEPLLKMPHVQRASPNPSIVDIMLLAKSQVLVATSNSTFSLWAAYLGQMPTVWYAGKSYPVLENPLSGIETDIWGNLAAGAETAMAWGKSAIQDPA